MEEQRWYFFRVGLVVLIAIVVMAILTVMFSDILKTQYSIYVVLEQAPGVTKDTPIRKHGITVGRVQNVEMLDSQVKLTLGIDSDKVIYEDEICQIKTSNFLGDAEIAFTNGTIPEDGLRTPLPTGGRVKYAAVAPNPMEIINVALDLKQNMANTLQSVEAAGTSIKTASDNVGQITGLVRDVLTDNSNGFKEFIENGQAISNKAELALDNFNSMMANVNDLVGDPKLKGNLSDTVAKMPQLLQEAEVTLQDIKDTIGPYKAVGERAEKNLANIEEFTKALGEDGPNAIADIRNSVEKVGNSLEKVETLIANLEEFSEQLKNKEGTVGKLFNDPQVYERLNSTLGNIERISVQVQPLIADFRVFADSLARDPAQLGVRGALQRTTGAGTKGPLLGRNPGMSSSGLGSGFGIFGGGNNNRATVIEDGWIEDSINQPIDYQTPMDVYPSESIRSVPEQSPQLLPQIQRPIWRPFARQ